MPGRARRCGPLGTQASARSPARATATPCVGRFKPKETRRYPIYVGNIYHWLMTPKTNAVARFLPLPPLDFQVLSVLATRELHGYAIVQAAAEALPGQPRLDVGSLYRIISRMLDGRLIREVKSPRGAPSDNRVRRYYTATDLGRAVARAEAERLQALLASPLTLRLLETEG